MSPAINAALGEGSKPMKIGAAAQFTQRELNRPERPSLAVVIAFFFSIILCRNVMEYITKIILSVFTAVTVLITVIAPVESGIPYRTQHTSEPTITAVDILPVFATIAITTAKTTRSFKSSIVTSKILYAFINLTIIQQKRRLFQVIIYFFCVFYCFDKKPRNSQPRNSVKFR